MGCPVAGPKRDAMHGRKAKDSHMVRMLGTVVAALLLVLSAAQAQAVGLGDIRLNSALNQPFDAEIELRNIQGLDEGEILARLASADDFERVGVERFFFLTNLRFSVERRRDGGGVLRVTSREPIVEPFVNFVVEVRWPAGRMLREYTVLLDPPAYAEREAPAVATPQQQRPDDGSAGRIERRTGTEVDLSPTPDTPSRPVTPPEERLTGDQYGRTDRDDTLWRIASRSRPEGVTVEQQMLAIARLNPQAFIGGNVNLLMAGHVLRLPSAEEAAELDTARARTEVAEHHEAFAAYRRGEGPARPAAVQPTDDAPAQRQQDATPERTAQPASETIPEAELRILAGDADPDGVAGGSASAEQLMQLEERLTASEDERERLALENEALAARVDDLSTRQQEFDRQLALRDQQLAELQAQLAEARQASPAQQQTSASTLDGLLSNWTLIAAALGLVLLLALALILQRRRAAAASDARMARLTPARADAAALGGAAVAAGQTAEEAESEADDEAAASELEDAQQDSADAVQDEFAGEPPGAQTSDVVAEADIYIAYNRFPQAVSLLQGALDQDPDRHDVRLKLLEVYAETGERDAFETHLAELIERCDDDDMLFSARELEARFSDDATRGNGETGEPAAPAEEADSTSTLDDFDLDLDLDLDEGTERTDTSDPQKASANQDSMLDLDDLDSPEAPDEAATDSNKTSAGDQLGGDLGLDFDPERDAEPTDSDDDTLRLDVGDQSDKAENDTLSLDDDFDFDLEDLQLDEAPAGKADELSMDDAASSPTETRDALDTGDVDGDELSADDSGDDVFSELDAEDAAATKLDLARAYIDMGDGDGAREILNEVMQDGSPEQQQQARALMQEVN